MTKRLWVAVSAVMLGACASAAATPVRTVGTGSTTSTTAVLEEPTTTTVPVPPAEAVLEEPTTSTSTVVPIPVRVTTTTSTALVTPTTTSTTLDPSEPVWFKDDRGFCFQASRGSLTNAPDSTCPQSGKAGPSLIYNEGSGGR